MTDKLIMALWEAVENEGYDREDIQSKSRKREAVDVRVAVAQLLYYRLGYTQIQIARVLNRGEHSIINHYVNHMDERDSYEFREMTKILNKVVDRYENHLAKFEL